MLARDGRVYTMSITRGMSLVGAHSEKDGLFGLLRCELGRLWVAVERAAQDT